MPRSMNSLLSMSFRVSAATLRASPFRTFLSTLGIVIGVASLVAVLSLGDGMQQFVLKQVNETTDLQAIGVNPQTTRTVDGVSVPLDSAVQLGAADAIALGAELGPGAAAGAALPLTALAESPRGQRAVRVVGRHFAAAAGRHGHAEPGAFQADRRDASRSGRHEPRRRSADQRDTRTRSATRDVDSFVDGARGDGRGRAAPARRRGAVARAALRPR